MWVFDKSSVERVCSVKIFSSLKQCWKSCRIRESWSIFWNNASNESSTWARAALRRGAHRRRYSNPGSSLYSCRCEPILPGDVHEWNGRNEEVEHWTTGTVILSAYQFFLNFQDVPEESIKLLIDYIYTDKIAITITNVHQLIFTATVLQVGSQVVIKFICAYQW